MQKLSHAQAVKSNLKDKMCEENVNFMQDTHDLEAHKAQTMEHDQCNAQTLEELMDHLNENLRQKRSSHKCFKAK